MLERLCEHNVTLTDPDATAGMGTLEGYWHVPVDIIVVGISVAPLEDDAGATLDVDDDGSNVISGIDASDANVPGTWFTPEMGGSQTPVRIAGGSKVSFDMNNAAVSNNFYISVWYLV